VPAGLEAGHDQVVGDTTPAADLGTADATTDEVYAVMDWLAGRQDAIETKHETSA
jgi:hypothetical protein